MFVCIETRIPKIFSNVDLKDRSGRPPMPETKRESLLKEFWRIVFVKHGWLVSGIMAVILLLEYLAWRYNW